MLDVVGLISPGEAFAKYAETTGNGWTGGDSTYSVQLPDGRLLWVFSDTFLGPLNEDGTRPVDAPIVRSSFVIQDGEQLTTITGGSADCPSSLMASTDDRHWYWAGDVMIAQISDIAHLQVIYHEYEKCGADPWDFRLHGNVVATFSLGDLSKPAHVDQLPSAVGISWGSALLRAGRSGDRYTYIYGTEDHPTDKKMHMARVKGTDLSAVSAWEFYRSDEGYWGRDESEATDLLTGVANEFSVTPWKFGFILLSHDSTEPFSNTIRIWHSQAEPFGPFAIWNGHRELHSIPEGSDGSCGNATGIITYNAHVHPALQKGNMWTLSYNVNTTDGRVTPDGAHYRDPSIYRPRFVSFPIESP
ncbi:hypothetical protein [Streptomyces sp. SAS_275]|uniref:hypothetical protein n=1 Tax=Streptomyces sp. SAS_275 TaxID=3412746 RepID=UPI00403CF1EB